MLAFAVISVALTCQCSEAWYSTVYELTTCRGFAGLLCWRSGFGTVFLSLALRHILLLAWHLVHWKIVGWSKAFRVYLFSSLLRRQRWMNIECWLIFLKFVIGGGRWVIFMVVCYFVNLVVSGIEAYLLVLVLVSLWCLWCPGCTSCALINKLLFGFFNK
jgi:hypothetical protein